MRLAYLLPFAAVISACGASDDSTQSAESTAGTGSVAVSPLLIGACSAMARVSRATLRVPIGRDRATSFAAPRQTPGTWNGCHLVGNGVVPADAAQAPASLLQSALAREGWTSDARFSATDSAATEFGVRRAGAVCVITTAGAGAGNAYRLEIRCTRAAAIKA
jgi:hypothetical protein